MYCKIMKKIQYLPAFQHLSQNMTESEFINRNSLIYFLHYILLYFKELKLRVLQRIKIVAVKYIEFLLAIEQVYTY